MSSPSWIFQCTFCLCHSRRRAVPSPLDMTICLLIPHLLDFLPPLICSFISFILFILFYLVMSVGFHQHSYPSPPLLHAKILGSDIHLTGLSYSPFSSDWTLNLGVPLDSVLNFIFLSRCPPPPMSSFSSNPGLSDLLIFLVYLVD